MLGKRLLSRVGSCGLAFMLCMQAGCLQMFHPVDPLPPEEVRDLLQVPTACKNGVYVFFLQGIDPLDLSNLKGLHDYVRSLGYIKTYFGLPFHAFYFEKEILAIRKREPNARIVLVGFSYGAGLIRDLACGLGKHGIDVDLLVYIDGVEVDSRPLIRPKNVGKVVNILANNRGDELFVCEAENVRYDDVYHFGTVTHPKTLRMLVRELGEVALRFPVVTDAPPVVPGVIVPTPQMLPAPKPTTKRGEWDFLQPDGNAGVVTGSKPTTAAFGMPPATLGQK